MKKLLIYVAPLALVFALAAALPTEAGITPSSVTSLRSPTPVLNGPILSGRVLNIGETFAVAPIFGAGLQRPVGSFAYDRTGQLAFLKTGSGATDWERLTAGSISGSGNAMGGRISRAQQLTQITSSALTCWRDDYNYNPTSLSLDALTSSGTVGISTNDVVGGHLTVSSGATAASVAVNTTAATMLGRPDVNRFYIAARIESNTAIDAATLYSVGASNNSLNFGVTMGICGPVSTTNWVYQYDGLPNCGGTVGSTGVPFVASTFVVLEIWGQGDGKVHFAVNQTEVSGSPFTMAASPVNSMRSYIGARNGTTAATRSVDLDWYMACWSET